MWCGQHDGDIVGYGATQAHQACTLEAGRRASNELCCLCGDAVPAGSGDSCGKDECVIKGYPPE